MRTYTNEKYGFRLTVPNGWRVHDQGIFSKLLSWYQRVDVRMTPIESIYPQLAVNVLDTRMKTVNDLKLLKLNVAKTLKAQVLVHGDYTVGETPGYFIVYRLRHDPKALQFFKASVIVDGWKYTFQFSTDDYERDKKGIQQFLKSARFSLS